MYSTVPAHRVICLILITCLHTVKWLNSCIWAKDWTLTGTTTLGQSGPKSNGNEEVLYIPQSSKTEASPSDGLVSYPGHLLVGVVLLLYRNAVGIFYCPIQLDCIHICSWLSHHSIKRKAMNVHNIKFWFDFSEPKILVLQCIIKDCSAQNIVTYKFKWSGK